MEAFHSTSIYGRNDGSPGDRVSVCLLPSQQTIVSVENSRLVIQELGSTPGPATTKTLIWACHTSLDLKFPIKKGKGAPIDNSFPL